MDPGVREAILALADAVDDYAARDAVWVGYSDSGYADLADAVDLAWEVLDVAERIVTGALLRLVGMYETYVDGEEL